MGSFEVLYDLEKNIDFRTVNTEFVSLDFDPPLGRQEFVNVGVEYTSLFEFAASSDEVPSEMDLFGHITFFLTIKFYKDGLLSLVPNPFSTTINIAVVESEKEEEKEEEEEQLGVNYHLSGSLLQLSQFPSDFPSLSPSQQPSQDASETVHAVTIEDELSENPSDTPSFTPTVDESEDPSGTPTFAPSMDESEVPSDAPSLFPSKVPTQLPTEAVVVDPSTEEEEKYSCPLCDVDLCIVRRTGTISISGFENQSCLDVLMRLRKGEEISEELCSALQEQFNERCLTLHP